MNPGGTANRSRSGLGKTEVTHLAGPNHFAHGTDGVLDGHIGVNPVLVIKVDLVDAEPLQALVTAFADIFRPAIYANKLSLGPPDIAKLGGQNHLIATALDGAAHEVFVDSATVHVGGVEEVDAQIERPMDGGDGFVVVTGAIEFRHSHAAQAEGRHG